MYIQGALLSLDFNCRRSLEFIWSYVHIHMCVCCRCSLSAEEIDQNYVGNSVKLVTWWDRRRYGKLMFLKERKLFLYLLILLESMFKYTMCRKFQFCALQHSLVF
jgi:hypothetical protein